MRILIADDTALNLESARRRLAGHDLILVSTYEKAARLIQQPHDVECVSRLLIEKFGTDDYDTLNDTRQKYLVDYFSTADRLAAKFPTAGFDVILLDLFMPPSAENQREPTKFAGQLMPVGFPLALMAARKPAAKYIGVVSATNHHDSPLVQAFSYLAEWDSEEDTALPAFNINGARVGFFEDHQGYFGDPNGEECWNCGRDEAKRASCSECEGVGRYSRGKAWHEYLARLMREA